ncbi:MAG: TraB/VirB10 family protein [Candidatus Tectimicrobiota bacterium]
MPAFLQHLGHWLRQHPVAAVLLAILVGGVSYWQLTPSPRRPPSTREGATTYQGTLPPRASLEAAMAQLQHDAERQRLVVEAHQKTLARLEQTQQGREQAMQRAFAERDERLEAVLRQVQEAAQQAQEAAQRLALPGVAAAPPPVVPLAPSRPQPAPPPPRPAPILRVLRPEKAPVATVPPSTDTRWAYLPAGSFVRGRLLTGLFATTQAGGALPALFAVREAFTGPNQTALPLEGCLAIGKAQADLAALRAIVQLTTLSCVFPDGRTLERAVTGYVTGPDGTLGMPGRLENRAGAYLANTFLTSLIAGAAEAFARAESTVAITPLGGSQTTLSGDVGKYAAFSSLATGTARLADFYQAQAEKLLPVVWVETGQDVHLVLQHGLRLDGLPASTAGLSE